MRVEVIGDATLYHADCMDVLPTLGKVDAVVTDPPYGIGFRYNEHKDMGGREYQDMLEHLTPFNKVVLQYPEEMMRYMCHLWGAPDDVYTWCYNSNTNRQTRLWGFWGLTPDWDMVRQPCKNPEDSRVNSDVRSYDWCSDVQQVKNISEEKTEHPCQIPLVMMSRIIRFIPDAQTILDPFMGSGTTGVAALDLGRKFIGIEKDERYFEIACRRVEDSLRQGKLF